MLEDLRLRIEILSSIRDYNCGLLRKLLGVPHDRLGVDIGISRQTLLNWETNRQATNGKRTFRTASTTSAYDAYISKNIDVLRGRIRRLKGEKLEAMHAMTK